MECYTTTLWYKIFSIIEVGPYLLNITIKHWKNQVCNHPFLCYNIGRTKMGWLLMIVKCIVYWNSTATTVKWPTKCTVTLLVPARKVQCVHPQDIQHISSWYWNPTPLCCSIGALTSAAMSEIRTHSSSMDYGTSGVYT